MKTHTSSDQPSRTGIRLKRFERKGTKESDDSNIDQLDNFMEQTLKEHLQRDPVMAQQSPIKMLPRAPVQQQDPTPQNLSFRLQPAGKSIPVFINGKKISQTTIVELPKPIPPATTTTTTVNSILRHPPLTKTVVNEIRRALPIVQQTTIKTNVPPPHMLMTLGRTSVVQATPTHIPIDPLADPKVLSQIEQMQRQINQLSQMLEGNQSKEMLNERRLGQIITLKDRELKQKEEQIWRYRANLEEMSYHTERKAKELEVIKQQLERQREKSQRSFQSVQGGHSFYESWQNIPRKQRELEIRRAQLLQDEKERNRQLQRRRQSKNTTNVFQKKWGNPPGPTGNQLRPQEQFLSPLSLTFDMKPALCIDDSKYFKFEDFQNM